jgi:hypothetical protein
MGRSFWELLWESLKSVFTAVIGIVALLLSVLLWAYAPDTQMSLRVVFPLGALILVLLVAALVTSLNAAYEGNRTANAERQKHAALLSDYNDLKARGAGEPSVIEGRSPPEGTQAALVCVLEPSQLFALDHMVSFYSIGRQGFEALVGIGVVTHVQGDRRIQVTMKLVKEGQELFAESLRQNEGEAVKSTVVRPGVPSEYTRF